MLLQSAAATVLVSSLFGDALDTLPKARTAARRSVC